MHRGTAKFVTSKAVATRDLYVYVNLGMCNRWRIEG